MRMTHKGQVTIPKRIRVAAGVGPGSQVSFSLKGGRIVITPSGARIKEDRRAKLKAAAARVRASLGAEFRQVTADEILTFIRGDASGPSALSSNTR